MLKSWLRPPPLLFFFLLSRHHTFAYPRPNRTGFSKKTQVDHKHWHSNAAYILSSTKLSIHGHAYLP
jgi:hypothetical protein